MKKRVGDFPFAKPTVEHRRQAQTLLHTFISNPHTELLPGQGNLTAVLRASNGAAIGFALASRTVNLVHLEPHQMIAKLFALNHGVTDAWRRGDIADESFRDHRAWFYDLRYRLHFWRRALPKLLDRLGCASDIRFVARLTVALNYEIPDPETPDKTPENHPFQHELPFPD